MKHRFTLYAEGPGVERWCEVAEELDVCKSNDYTVARQVLKENLGDDFVAHVEALRSLEAEIVFEYDTETCGLEVVSCKALTD